MLLNLDAFYDGAGLASPSSSDSPDSKELPSSASSSELSFAASDLDSSPSFALVRFSFKGVGFPDEKGVDLLLMLLSNFEFIFENLSLMFVMFGFKYSLYLIVVMNYKN